MSKNNYENHKERNLQKAVNWLKSRKEIMTTGNDEAINYVAGLYKLSIDEVKCAMDGEL